MHKSTQNVQFTGEHGSQAQMTARTKIRFQHDMTCKYHHHITYTILSISYHHIHMLERRGGSRVKGQEECIHYPHERECSPLFRGLLHCPTTPGPLEWREQKPLQPGNKKKQRACPSHGQQQKSHTTSTYTWSHAHTHKPPKQKKQTKQTHTRIWTLTIGHTHVHTNTHTCIYMCVWVGVGGCG